MGKLIHNIDQMDSCEKSATRQVRIYPTVQLEEETYFQSCCPFEGGTDVERQ